MIPKIIHYCWFGGNDKPKMVIDCINSWKKFMPDYEIIEWNESNFDVNCNDFVKMAYEKKKWAFISDFCRLFALFNYGGIYMDTDVEVLKSFDPLLNHNFLCYEQDEYICTAVMGFEKGSLFLKEFMDKYKSECFNLSKPNSKHLYEFLRDKISIPKNINLCFEGKDILFLTSDYFSPKDYVTKKLCITNNTYSIHHFDGSWKDSKSKLKDRMQNLGIKFLGKDRYYLLKNKFLKK